MANMKKSNSYYFSVAGETEDLYFDKLEDLINQCKEKDYGVKFDIKIQSSPKKRAKTLSNLYSTEIFHICDYESNDDFHTKQFKTMLDEIKEVKEDEKYKKDISYIVGYSNFAFELWMVLHKIDCNTLLADRTKYVSKINEAYSTDYQFLKEYKKKAEFKKILDKITLQDVINAITRADKIRQNHIQNGYIPLEYKGFKYYKDNPDLTIHECIKKILKDCKIIAS